MLSGLAYDGMPAPFRLENFSFYDCFRFAIFLIRFFVRTRKKHRVYWRMREHFDDVMAEKRSKKRVRIRYSMLKLRRAFEGVYEKNIPSE